MGSVGSMPRKGFCIEKGGPRVEGARRDVNLPAGAKEAVPGIGADLTAQVV